MADGTKTTLDSLVRTRRALHGLGELVLAGPQYRTSGTIRLRVSRGGFGTVRQPAIWTDGVDLVAGETRVPLAGTTYAELAKTVGVDVGAPEGLYHDGSGAGPDDELDIDPAAARQILDAFALGDEALRRVAPDETPVLWPEHFDLGIALDEVNYGVSAGDTYHEGPYAYVGPWQPRSGPFWNAPFGAARPVGDLGDVDGLVAFFDEGRARAHKDPTAT